jgi:hypothetical protein
MQVRLWHVGPLEASKAGGCRHASRHPLGAVLLYEYEQSGGDRDSIN